jgi:branched-chain amino acid transport system permease protein
MRIWLQLLIAGFSLGSFYALVAMGFSLIFGVTHAFNLAHGELILLSGYLAYGLWKFWHVSFYATLPVCCLVMLVCALLLQALLRKVKEPYELNTLVITFGLALVLQNAMLFGFSANYRLISAAKVQWVLIPGIQLSIAKSQAILILLSLAATGAVHLLLRKTYLGKALRATIQDREAARLAGINAEHMSLIAFALGGMLIGLAGPLFGQTTYLFPAGGTEATLIAIIITIFAGVGRTRGLLLGGWILGLVESFAAFVVGASWRELISACLLITLLLLKPEGIFSKGPQ